MDLIFIFWWFKLIQNDKLHGEIPWDYVCDIWNFAMCFWQIIDSMQHVNLGGLLHIAILWTRDQVYTVWSNMCMCLKMGYTRHNKISGRSHFQTKSIQSKCEVIHDVWGTLTVMNTWKPGIWMDCILFSSFWIILPRSIYKPVSSNLAPGLPYQFRLESFMNKGLSSVIVGFPHDWCDFTALNCNCI